MVHRTKQPTAPIIVLIVATGIIQYGVLPPQTIPSASAQIQQTSVEFDSAMTIGRLGYSAVSIAAGGGVAGDATAAIANLAELDTELGNLANLQSLRDFSAQGVAEIRESIWRGGASVAQLSVLTAAESELAIHQAALDQAEGGLCAHLDAFLENALGASGTATMGRVHANRERRVPDHFKALELDDTDWHLLEAACVKSSRNIPLTADESSILTQCQSDPQSILVASRLATNLSPIESVFDAALAIQE